MNKVDPLVEDSALMSPRVAERIRIYYGVNHIDVFSYSRPFHRGKKDGENEFATLWTEKTTLKTIYSLPGYFSFSFFLMILSYLPPLVWGEMELQEF